MMPAVATISYFKRYKMEADLHSLPPPRVPAGCHWIAWHDGLLEAHADTLFACFQQEIDATVFPSLGDRTGCLTLMTEIVRKPGFHPEATWLLANDRGPVGTIQGIRERGGLGAIQNVGIVAPLRGQGLGEALVLQALHGFRRAGVHRAVLEVTAQNGPAIRLYRRLGFRRAKTIYKAVQDHRCGQPV
jgi:ribosomal protein S18 acetylase RimI-like enzyme